ncbi:hypothetical protein BD560DRAFT_474437 [Blakeslea trispora]|nr:hypothetical protein BD560DRAFT_474437 [Blakeslea trispora]
MLTSFSDVKNNVINVPSLYQLKVIDRDQAGVTIETCYHVLVSSSLTRAFSIKTTINTGDHFRAGVMPIFADQLICNHARSRSTFNLCESRYIRQVFSDPPTEVVFSPVWGKHIKVFVVNKMLVDSSSIIGDLDAVVADLNATPDDMCFIMRLIVSKCLCLWLIQDSCWVLQPALVLTCFVSIVVSERLPKRLLKKTNSTRNKRKSWILNTFRTRKYTYTEQGNQLDPKSSRLLMYTHDSTTTTL